MGLSRKEALINKVAIYAYYFLVIGVLLGPADYLRERKEFVKFLVKYWEMEENRIDNSKI